MNAGRARAAMRGARCGAAWRDGMDDGSQAPALHRALRQRPCGMAREARRRPRHHVRAAALPRVALPYAVPEQGGPSAPPPGSSPAVSSSAMSSSATTAVSASFPRLGRCRTDERRDGDDGDGEGARLGACEASLPLRNPAQAITREMRICCARSGTTGRRGGNRSPALVESFHQSAGSPYALQTRTPDQSRSHAKIISLQSGQFCTDARAAFVRSCRARRFRQTPCPVSIRRIAKNAPRRCVSWRPCRRSDDQSGAPPYTSASLANRSSGSTGPTCRMSLCTLRPILTTACFREAAEERR